MDIGILALGGIGAIASGWWFARSVRATIARETMLAERLITQPQPARPRHAIVPAAVETRSSTAA